MEKGEATAAVAADGSLSGIIRYEVDNVSTLDEDGRCSHEIEVGGVRWRVYVCKETKVDGKQGFRVHLYSEHNESRLWSIDVKADRIVVNSDSTQNIVKPFSNGTHTYCHDKYGWGGWILNWSDLLDEEMGFIKDDKITVEVRFSLTNIRGIRTASLIDYTDPNEPRHDVTLVIGGEKVYVSKQILSFHSEFFNAMFYGHFDEKNQTEIELKELDRAEFIEMLYVIYPSNKKITDHNVKFLLKLGDRFQMKFLLDSAENHLVSSSNPELVAKMLLSDQYRLVKLQDHCLKQLTTAQILKEVQKSPEYKDLTETTKVAVLEKMIKFVQ